MNVIVSKCGTNKFVVDEMYFNRIGEQYQNKDYLFLILFTDIMRHLHNQTGPALILTYPHCAPLELYYIDGKQLLGKEREQFVHNLTFADMLEDIL